MKNPKTTIVGYLALASAVLTIVIKFLQGDAITMDEILLVVSGASGGIAGIAAKDGSH